MKGKLISLSDTLLIIMFKYKEGLRCITNIWPCSTCILERIECKVLVVQPINHVSVGPTDGIGPTQGQVKTLTRVGIEHKTFGFDHRCSTD